MWIVVHPIFDKDGGNLTIDNGSKNTSFDSDIYLTYTYLTSMSKCPWLHPNGRDANLSKWKYRTPLIETQILASKIQNILQLQKLQVLVV